MPRQVYVPQMYSCEPSSVWGLGLASQVRVSRRPDGSSSKHAEREAEYQRVGQDQRAQLG